MPVRLLCPRCNRAFAEEKNPQNMLKTVENVKTICLDKGVGFGERKMQCAFCGGVFDINECRVIETPVMTDSMKCPKCGSEKSRQLGILWNIRRCKSCGIKFQITIKNKKVTP